MNTELEQKARGRVGSLLDFLSAFHARKNPPVRDISKYNLEVFRENDFRQVTGISFTPSAESWLTVSFLERPPAPEVPIHLQPMLEAAIGLSPLIRPEVRLPDEPTEEDLERGVEAEQWVVSTWQSWAKRWSEVEVVKNLYRRLFEAKEQLNNDRDGLELVWGFGRVRWDVEQGNAIDHPLLTIPVEIEVESPTNSLVIRPAGALVVESLYLSDVSLSDRKAFNLARQSLEEITDAVDPWSEVSQPDLLRRITRSLSQDSVFVELPDTAQPSSAPNADSSWVLFVRRRDLNYQGFLDAMRNLYESGSEVPSPLKAVVIDEPSLLVSEISESATPDDQGRGDTAQLLLPKPTNEEQERILRLAQSRPGVTVQGPPGTGKSHTIANIISHYVAHGKRVLVVAEKEQALRVLSDKIPEGIRDLTVSVLGNDESGRRRLESSINKIQTHVTGLDRSLSDNEIARLTSELDAIDRRIAETTHRLREARAREVAQLNGTWSALSDPTPAQAAEWTARNSEELGYIPDRIDVTTPQPLKAGEFSEFLELLREVGVDTAEACGYLLPDLAQLPTGQELASWFSAVDAVADALRSVGSRIHNLESAEAAGSAQLQDLESRLVQELDYRKKVSVGWLQVVLKQLSDPQLRPGWIDFVESLVAEREQILTLNRGLEAHTISVPASPQPDLEINLSVAKDRLGIKGKLGFFASDVKKSLSECLVDGHPPLMVDEVDLCLSALRRQSLRNRVITRWKNRLINVGAPELEASQPEINLGGLLDDLDALIESDSREAELQRDLSDSGFSTPPTLSITEIEDLISAVRVADQYGRSRSTERKIEDLRSALVAGAATPDASLLWSKFVDLLDRRSTERWDELRTEVLELQGVSPKARQLRALRDRLRSVAPIWADQISRDPDLGRRPSDFDSAWQWRQLDCWVDEIANSDDPAELQKALEALSSDRLRCIARLVEERAWRGLADNLGDKERSALNRYLTAFKRFGKTGGKYAARWIQEIRQALNESKDAVPVWVMTTGRALSSFRPSDTPPFDLLIVDEASQIGIEAIPLLALAKSTIIVGDDKQTSPENVGALQQAFFDLLDDHLSSIRNYKTLFDINASLYDIAFQKFPGEIMLTEHFRCLPEIIRFSNEHVYDERIIPLRDQAPTPGWRPLGAIKVLDGYRKGDINEPEAEAIVDLIERLCGDPDYDDMTFGVISLLGTSQSKTIWEKLLDRLGPDEMSRREIRCGEPANFQGDERDVIVISTVVAVDPSTSAVRLSSMTKETDLRRINVAASRARNQLWVVHSIDADEFSRGDLRAALINHCRNPFEVTVSADDFVTESDFEREVLKRILGKGYKQVRTQYKVGRFRIDIVVEGPDSRLAVECDGDRWHGPDVWLQDYQRQLVLERAGWTFERIRGSAFYRNPDSALQPLWARLDELGIPPGEEWAQERQAATVLEVLAMVGAGKATGPSASLGGSNGSDLVPEETAAGALITAREWIPEGSAVKVESAAVASGLLPMLNDQPEKSLAPIDKTVQRKSGVKQLSPYTTWTPRPLPELEYATVGQVIEGLQDIVATEGPIHTWRAYQLYVKGSGHHRVGRDMRVALNKALFRAQKSGLISQLSDSTSDQVSKTLYLPGGSPVVLRELGPRVLIEVPRSELQQLASELGFSAASEEAFRAMLDALGLTRLTDRAEEYLHEVFSYTWEE